MLGFFIALFLNRRSNDHGRLSGRTRSRNRGFCRRISRRGNLGQS
jgi:hypothetical protein